MQNIKLDKTGCIKNVTEWWWILEWLLPSAGWMGGGGHCQSAMIHYHHHYNHLLHQYQDHHQDHHHHHHHHSQCHYHHQHYHGMAVTKRGVDGWWWSECHHSPSAGPLLQLLNSNHHHHPQILMCWVKMGLLFSLIEAILKNVNVPQTPISFGPLKLFDSNHNIKINKLYSPNNKNTQLIVFAWELAIFCHHNNNHHHVWISQLGIEAISSHDLMTIRWRWSSAWWWLKSSLL